MPGGEGMKEFRRPTADWAQIAVFVLAALVVAVPLVACFMLPQSDIPGRIAWLVRRGTMGASTSVIPNDDFTTGLLAAVFLCLNFAIPVLLGFALDARSKLRMGRESRPGRYWAACACLLIAYAGLVTGASRVCAVVGPGGFASKEFCSGVVIHRWPEVVAIRRLHIIYHSPRRQGYECEYAASPTQESLQYKLVYSDGAVWESANSRNWAWPIIDRAMHRASSFAGVAIKDYRRRG